jgi:hypothetical protein
VDIVNRWIAEPSVSVPNKSQMVVIGLATGVERIGQTRWQ